MHEVNTRCMSGLASRYLEINDFLAINRDNCDESPLSMISAINRDIFV